ncbi:SirB2 family protein [Phenylobacterium sp.]|uniref:SirB2 family protein n=1 Tax=Phenylobacterium sp. TaxID=1871053 RepID=UPI00286E530F|nr:SirB2 family protein [Phenylobacterium sp.]
MEEFYPVIRTIHIWAVVASGLLFALRGGAWNLLEARWPKVLPVRILSWVIDSALLSAALILTTLIQQYPFADAWLTTKVVLLVVYIGLGAMAFSQRRSRSVRIGFWVAALCVFGFIVSVARAHSPLGLFASLGA